MALRTLFQMNDVALYNAYIRVTFAELDHTGHIVAVAEIFPNVELRELDKCCIANRIFRFENDVDEVNKTVVAYNRIKMLPEFAGAEEC